MREFSSDFSSDFAVTTNLGVQAQRVQLVRTILPADDTAMVSVELAHVVQPPGIAHQTAVTQGTSGLKLIQ